MINGLTISWCTEPEEASALAAFFVRHVTSDTSYISHGELQLGRAETPDRWSANLLALVTQEIGNRIPRAEVLTARIHSELVGIAVVGFDRAAACAFGIVEDLVVDSSRRGSGIGHFMLQWIEDRARESGLVRLFLESGTRNHRAHAFFERHAFHPCSVTMMKAIGGA